MLDPLRADVDAWRSLALSASEPNPFFEPELVLPAVRHLGGDGVRLLVATDGGEWIGVVPVRRMSQWKGMPSLLRGPWMHPYCFLGAPLLASGREDEAMDQLVAELRHGSSLVPLEYLPADGPVGQAVRGALKRTGARAVVWRTFERAALQRRPENDYVETTLASKRRRELRRQRKLLEEALGPVVTTDEGADELAVEAFLALEASGWKGRAGTAMATAAHDMFLREACAAFREAGRLQVVAVRAGSHFVAAQINFLAGEGVFCFKLAFDEAQRAFSPGVQLQLDNVHLFHGRPELQWQDSCADPNNQMINRLWPDRRRLTTLLVPGNGARGRVGRVQAGVAKGVRNRRKEHA